MIKNTVFENRFNNKQNLIRSKMFLIRKRKKNMNKKTNLFKEEVFVSINSKKSTGVHCLLTGKERFCDDSIHTPANTNRIGRFQMDSKNSKIFEIQSRHSSPMYHIRVYIAFLEHF